MSEEKKDFVVKDRRIFSQEGDEKKEDDEKKEENAASSAADKPTEQASQEQTAAREQEEEPQLPEINFPTFVASLNASALVHLGVIDDPAIGKKSKNLPMAKQTIDILNMLEKKTEGNLTKEEENMLKNVLYDLRIMYVKEKG
ncbi:MAG: DUF1844 domain-containing protein [Desulfobacterales bacterium]|nr:MAG: DUF1844 domain-containing protein [Desulfobacterales bacterium]